MGLKPEHIEELNSIWLESMEHQRRRFAELREYYKDDGVAQQYIDVFDGESRYHPHMRAATDAYRVGDEETFISEKAWLREHYPDIK